MPASAVDAQLSFKRCTSLDLALSYADGTLVGEKLGPSVVTLDVPVSAGDYAYTVSAGRCSFTLTVTVTPSG